MTRNISFKKGLHVESETKERKGLWSWEDISWGIKHSR